MSNGIILYKSKYGATKKYADWLCEKTNFECVPVEKASVKKVASYDVIILAGAIYASGISGLKFLKNNIKSFAEKKVAVFCVGASPYDEKAFSQICNFNFKDDLVGTPCFYGRGAWNEDAMSFMDKTLCKMLQKVVAKQDPSTFEPWQKALVNSFGKKCDWTDEKYLTPLLDWIKK